MKTENVNTIVLSPRPQATGAPANDALENLITSSLADGALCYVRTGAGQGLWQLEKSATTAADGTTVVQPIAGGGRWFKKVGPGVPSDLGLGSGAILRSDHDTTTVSVGTIGAGLTEIQTDMTDATPTMRVSLANTLSTRVYRGKASCVFKMLQGATSAVTPSGGVLTIQASVDNFASVLTVAAGSSVPDQTGFETVSGNAFTILRADAEGEFLAASVPNWTAGATITLRAMASTSIPGNTSVNSTGTTGTHLTLEELVA